MYRSILSFKAVNHQIHLLGDKKVVRLLLLFLLITPLYQCTGQQTASDGGYTYKNGDLNGIGKWYMDREIAYVMGFQGSS